MSNEVGGIEFYIDADARGVLAAGEAVHKTSADMLSDFGKVDKATTDLITSQISLGNTITKTGKVIDAQGNEIKGATSALTQLINKQKSLQEQSIKVQSAQDSLSKTFLKSNKGLASFGRSSGQVGIQFQQFIGQIQGGQSAMLALSQQAADIGIVMGAPLIGAVAGITASLLGMLIPSLFKSKEAVDDVIKKLKELKDTQILTEAQAKALAIAEAESKEEKRKKIKELDKEIKKLKELETLQSGQKDSTGGGRTGAAQRKTADKRLKETREELVKLQSQVDTLKQQAGDLDISVGGDDLKALEAFRSANEARIESLRSSLDIESQLLSAHAQTRKAISDGIYSQQEGAQIEADIARQSRITTQFDALVVQLESEKKAVIDAEIIKGEELALVVAEFDALKLEAEANKNQKIEQQAIDHKDKMIALKKAEEQAKQQAVRGAFSNLSSLMNTESRKLFEIGKVAAISGAVVDGLSAAVTNYKQGSKIGGPPVGAAFAAASLVATGSQIQQIKSQQFGGGGSSSTSFSDGVPTTNTSSSNSSSQQNISISGIDANSLVSGSQLVNTLNEALGDGYTINFAGS